jgi:hypothetical protein
MLFDVFEEKDATAKDLELTVRSAALELSQRP